MSRSRAEAIGSTFIVGPVYDSLFFVWSPLLALTAGMLLSASRLNQASWKLGDGETTIMASLIGIFIHAHLIVVVFRSHLNPSIRRLYPRRFLLVPPLLLGGMLLSDWFLVTISVLATFWDVYHSGLQTFGLGRIYDLRAGNHPRTARNLDMLLNHLLYAGPIIAGVTMMDHFEDFHEFESVGSTLFNVVPAFMDSNQRYFAWALLLGGSTFLAYYVWAYVRMAQKGHRVSIPKVCLLASTGLCSIYTWGFNSWGEAFFIMNLFHAVQYFALVWWKEQGTMTQVFRTARLRFSKPITCALFLGVGLTYGIMIEAVPSSVPLIYPLSLVVSICHFWYDGFIWSVRKKQV